MAGYDIRDRFRKWFAEIRFKLAAAPGGDLHNLDHWLLTRLELSEQDLPAGPVPGLDASLVPAHQYLARVFAVARLLLQLGRVPVFDLPVLQSLRRSDEDPFQVIAVIRVAAIDHVPSSCYQLVIAESLRLCERLAKEAVTEAAVQDVYSVIGTNVVRHLHKAVASGKSTIPVLRAAHSLGIPYMHLGLGVYQLGWGSKARRMDRSTVGEDSAMGAKLAQRKQAAASLLKMAGLPAAVHVTVEAENAAVAAANTIGFPVVVKPADRDRGEGVTVDVGCEASVRAAFTRARKLSKAGQVLIERQVPGTCHRLFIAGGKLLYAVKRLPMSVTGDGTHTVAELVQAEVAAQGLRPPWKRTEIQPIDDLATESIARAGYTLEAVPAKGALVPLRRIETTAWGGVDEDVTDRIHPANLSIALRAAKVFGLHVVGVDMITPDIERPWFENGAIINEVNFAPLLGGGDISRAHIPDLLADFIDGSGEIPIELFDARNGGDRVARERWQQLAGSGKGCFLLAGGSMIDPAGRQLHLPTASMVEAIRALLLHPDTDYVVVAAANSAVSPSDAAPAPISGPAPSE